MEHIPAAEVERTMRVQEVMRQTMARKITWWLAAEILGVTDRTMRRWNGRQDRFGFRALFDARRAERTGGRLRQKKSRKKVLKLYREKVLRLQRATFSRKVARGPKTNVLSTTAFHQVLRGGEFL